MIIFESIKLALSAVWTHKARSFLTMLGIIIGITSIITLISIGEGVKFEVKKTVADFGSDYIYIIPGNIKPQEIQNSMGKNQMNSMNFISSDIFTNSDLEELKKIDGVEYVAPMSMVSGIVKFDDKTISPMLMGTEPEIEKIFDGFTTSEGRFINQADIDNKNHVISISQSYAEEFCETAKDCLGKKITVISQDKEIEYEILGILANPTSGSIFSTEMQSMALLPYSTAKADYYKDEDKIFRIGAKGYENTNIKELSKKIEENLLKRHDKAEFSVLTPDDMMGMLETIMNLLTTFISAIAAISLVVGGVGIMNIMLVSVTERTREIGLRKAVGATNGIILLQFLIEAVILSIIGGLISLALVKIAVWLISRITTIHPIITFNSVILAMGICVFLGIIFGLAPAIQASRKNPIDALRYE